MVALFSKFYSKIRVGFCLNTGKPLRKSIGFSKKRYQGFSKQPSVLEISMFYVTITGNLEYVNFATNFLENERLFFKKWSTIFQLKVLRLEAHHSHAKLPCQKAILRQIERRVQNRPITRSFTSNYFIFLKILLQFKNFL